MNRLRNLLVGLLARSLGVDERDAVLGDLAECHAGETEVLMSLTNLVARRQWESWRGWRPWVALGLLALPLGMLLGLCARLMANGQAVYLWMYANNWTSTYLGVGWFWSELVPTLGWTLLAWSILGCFSSAAGVLIGALAGRTAWLSAIVFIFALLDGNFLERLLTHVSPLWMWPARGFDPNAAVFSLGFYRVVLPLLLQTFFVMMPAYFGMRKAGFMSAPGH